MNNVNYNEGIIMNKVFSLQKLLNTFCFRVEVSFLFLTTHRFHMPATKASWSLEN